ncbi:hypothetical protein SELMODRAFT_91529, partial [Selaginella moellendorffii]
VCSAGLDFGKINQKFLGQKNRYVYMRYYGPWPKLSGVAKVDLDPTAVQCVTRTSRSRALWCQGDSNVVSFVANGEEKGDGYVLSYVHDEKNGVSELLVIDAKSPTL